MAFTPNTDGHSYKRSDNWVFDPDGLICNFSQNIARGGDPIVVDDNLKSLAMSMLPKNHPQGSSSSGQVHPIKCRRINDRQLEVVAGFRRYRAIKWLKEEGIWSDAVIRAEIVDMSAVDAAIMNFIENEEREAPKPVQQAMAISAFIDTYGMPIEEVAKKLRRSVAYCERLLSLLRVDNRIQTSVASGELPVEAALTLGHLPEPEQVKAFTDMKNTGNMSVKAAKDKVRAAQKTQPAPSPAPSSKAASNGSTAVASKPAKPVKLSRTFSEVKTFLKSQIVKTKGGKKTKAEDKNSYGSGVAEMLIEFCDGTIDETELQDRWVKYFDGDISEGE